MGPNEFLEQFDSNREARNFASQAIECFEKRVGSKWFELIWGDTIIKGINELFLYLDRSASGELGKMEFSDEAIEALPYDLSRRLLEVRGVLNEAAALHSSDLNELQRKIAKLLEEDTETRQQLKGFDFDDETAPVDSLHACSEHAVKAVFIAINQQALLLKRGAKTEWNENALVGFLLAIGEARSCRLEASDIQVAAPELVVFGSVMRHLSEIAARLAIAAE
jgi:hypothetical protein